ncbi:threonine/serine exporter family protein [Curtobacterium flaccumfaciens pv. flaccumfaciens]
MVGLGSALANLQNALRRPEAHVEVVDGESVPVGMLLGTLGALLLDAGSSVTDVRSALEKARDAAGVGPSLAIGVLPALVMVSEVSTGAATIVNAEGVELSSRQAARANRVVLGLESGSIALAEIPARVRAIRAGTVPPPALPWILGNALTSAGLAVVFRCPWWAIVLALVVGGLVGVIGLVLRRFREAVAIIPFLAAFVSTAIVGLVAAGTGFEQVPLFAVCAPVAVFVPGALITNALLELTAADIVTGSSRLVQGLIMLGFMAAGIASGSALTGLHVDPSSAALVGEVAGGRHRPGRLGVRARVLGVVGGRRGARGRARSGVPVRVAPDARVGGGHGHRLRRGEHDDAALGQRRRDRGRGGAAVRRDPVARAARAGDPGDGVVLPGVPAARAGDGRAGGGGHLRSRGGRDPARDLRQPVHRDEDRRAPARPLRPQRAPARGGRDQLTDGRPVAAPPRASRPSPAGYRARYGSISRPAAWSAAAVSFAR